MLRSRDTVLLAKRLFHAKHPGSAFSGGVAHPRWQPDIQHQIPAYQIRLESEFECAVCRYARTTRRGRGVLFLATDGAAAGVACRLSQNDFLWSGKAFFSLCGWRVHTALRVAPNYADAMFNLALLLQRTNQYAEAANYWRRYLASDCQSDWATRARRSLKFCEMQVNLIASA